MSVRVVRTDPWEAVMSLDSWISVVKLEESLSNENIPSAFLLTQPRRRRG